MSSKGYWRTLFERDEMAHITDIDGKLRDMCRKGRALLFIVSVYITS